MQKLLKISLSISLLATFVACTDKSELYDKKNAEYQGATIQFDTVITKYSEDAKLKIKIEAPLQEVFANNDVYYPKGVHISMYNANGIKTTDLQADTGRYEAASQKYRGNGNVVVTNLEEQQTLYTEELFWFQGRKEITTDKPIKIITTKEKLEGIGLTSNEEFSKYTIKRPTGVFALEKKEK